MPFRSFRSSPHLRSRAAVVATAASLAGGLVPALAYAQPVYQPYSPPPPPAYAPYPPPPPPGPYYRVYRREPEPLSALALGLDVEGSIPINGPQLANGNNLQGGGGVKFRVGDQIRLDPVFRVTPEIGYGYDHLYATNNFSYAYSWDLNRLFGGVRLAFGEFIVPSIYGHVGYGWRTTGDVSVQSASGVAVDVGGAIDMRLYRRFQFGVHGEWVTINAQPYAPEWVAIGLHLDVAL